MKTQLESNILTRIKKGEILVCDGAMGTLLSQEGLESGICGDLWNITHPEKIMAIHKAYLEAGCDIIITNTFNANRIKLAKFGFDNLEEKIADINIAAVKLAKSALREWISTAESKKEIYIFGDVGPTGEFLEPLGTFTAEEFIKSFAEQINYLVSAGVDAIIIETMTSLEEIECAIKAAKEAVNSSIRNQKIPIIALMTFSKTKHGYRTLMGVDIKTAVSKLMELDADIIGSNCGNGIKEMVEIIREMRSYTEKPLIAEPNAGIPKVVNNRIIYDDTPEVFASAVIDLISAGANIIGGCCGTTPAHLRAMVTIKQNLKI